MCVHSHKSHAFQPLFRLMSRGERGKSSFACSRWQPSLVFDILHVMSHSVAVFLLFFFNVKKTEKTASETLFTTQTSLDALGRTQWQCDERSFLSFHLNSHTYISCAVFALRLPCSSQNSILKYPEGDGIWNLNIVVYWSTRRFSLIEAAEHFL